MSEINEIDEKMFTAFEFMSVNDRDTAYASFDTVEKKKELQDSYLAYLKKITDEKKSAQIPKKQTTFNLSSLNNLPF